MGFRAIERVTGVCHNTAINWVKLADKILPDEDYEIPQTAQVDELQTFVGSKKSKSGNRIAVNSQAAGILKWVVGDRSLATFRLLWLMIRGWCCFLYITDGYPVYSCLIDDCDHLASKTAMTRVAGENSRLRHKKSAVASLIPFAIPSQSRCLKHRFVC